MGIDVNGLNAIFTTLVAIGVILFFILIVLVGLLFKETK